MTLQEAIAKAEEFRVTLEQVRTRLQQYKDSTSQSERAQLVTGADDMLQAAATEMSAVLGDMQQAT